MFRTRFSVLILLLCSSQLGFAATDSNTVPLKYAEPHLLHGRILSADRSQTLFNFTRQSSRSGDRLDVVRDYSYPDGKLAARERVRYEGNDLVFFSLEETQTGSHGKVEVKHNPQKSQKDDLIFEYSKEGRSTPKKSEALLPNLLTSDMVAPFLVDHWAALLRGDSVKCRFIVIPRRETVGFKFMIAGQSGEPGHECVLIKMVPTSPIIAALVDPVTFTVEKTGRHRVLEYRGRTTPKKKAGDGWEDLDAVTVFDW